MVAKTHGREIQKMTRYNEKEINQVMEACKKSGLNYSAYSRSKLLEISSKELDVKKGASE